jgi:hypothetical protein
MLCSFIHVFSYTDTLCLRPRGILMKLVIFAHARILAYHNTYLRYEPSACFGLVGSLKANVLFVEGKALGLKSTVQLAICPALEDVFIWDTKRQEKVN